MLEKKSRRPTDLREVFATYEVALSPLTISLGLTFAIYWLARFFSFNKTIPMMLGASLGFFIGLRRLINYLKKKSLEQADAKKE